MLCLTGPLAGYPNNTPCTASPGVFSEQLMSGHNGPKQSKHIDVLGLSGWDMGLEGPT